MISQVVGALHIMISVEQCPYICRYPLAHRHYLRWQLFHQCGNVSHSESDLLLRHEKLCTFFYELSIDTSHHASLHLTCAPINYTCFMYRSLACMSNLYLHITVAYPVRERKIILCHITEWDIWSTHNQLMWHWIVRFLFAQQVCMSQVKVVVYNLCVRMCLYVLTCEYDACGDCGYVRHIIIIIDRQIKRVTIYWNIMAQNYNNNLKREMAPPIILNHMALKNFSTTLWLCRASQRGILIIPTRVLH